MASFMEGPGRCMTFVVTRPEHDPATRYLARWAEEVMKLARTKGQDVIDLHRTDANRNALQGRLKKVRPVLLMLNGHGTTDSVLGHDDEILLSCGDDCALLEGMATYAVSCSSAHHFGRDVGLQPDTVYIGYDDEFTFAMSRDSVNRPLEDPLADPFRETSNAIPLTLLKGLSATEAIDKSKKLAERHIQRLVSSASDPDSRLAARLLWWNAQRLVCHGDEAKKL